MHVFTLWYIFKTFRIFSNRCFLTDEDSNVSDKQVIYFYFPSTLKKLWAALVFLDACQSSVNFFLVFKTQIFHNFVPPLLFLKEKNTSRLLYLLIWFALFHCLTTCFISNLHVYPFFIDNNYAILYDNANYIFEKEKVLGRLFLFVCLFVWDFVISATEHISATCQIWIYYK